VRPLSGALATLVSVGISVGFLAPACLDATAVRVHLYSDIPWRTGRSVAIRAAPPDLVARSEPVAQVDIPWGSPDLGDLVLLPPRAEGEGGTLSLLVVTGVTREASSCSVESPVGCVFTRRRLRYLPHRTLNLPVLLSASCLGVVCTPDTTCAVGQCISADVDPSACASPEGCFLPGEEAPIARAAAVANDSGAAIQADAGGEGAPCASGSACASGLFCFVGGPGPSGTCTRIPTACGARLDCSSRTCLDGISQPCASSAGAECLGIAGWMMARCPGLARRMEGESCSFLGPCVKGLFCFVSAGGQAGVCEKLPAACGTNLCSCLAERCTVPNCISAGGGVTIECK